MLIALTLTTVAGLATIIGGIIAVSAKDPALMLGPSLAFSAGAMSSVSVLELLPAALSEAHPLTVAAAMAVGALVVLTLMFVTRERAHEVVHDSIAESGAAFTSVPVATPTPTQRVAQTVPRGNPPHSLMRTGLVTTVILTAHNIPEGFATFAGALNDPVFALPLVAAIALHNIPEGLAVASPLYSATASRARALIAATFSGLSEPLGALILWCVLGSTGVLAARGIIDGPIAAVMITVSICELLPAALREIGAYKSVLPFSAGIGVMALSLWALGSL